MSLQITIKDRSDKEIASFTIESSSKVALLKKKLSQNLKKDPLRIHLSYKSMVLDDNDRILSTYNLDPTVVLIYKDLGPQILWKTVFFIEYLGPMIIYAALYLYSKYTGRLINKNLQGLIAIMGCSHFLKRVLETAFVHIFSRDSMPKKRLFINCLHYWFLFGINVGIESFFFWKDPEYSTSIKLVLVSGFFFSELMNLNCHLILKNLRSKSDTVVSARKVRGIPQGGGFQFVSCANYFWEVASWVFFSAFTRCYTSYFFLGCSFYQMTVWALEKHRRYRKELGDSYPKERKAIIPFIL